MNYDDWKTTPPDYEEPSEEESEDERSEENEDFSDDYEQEPFYEDGEPEDTGTYQSGYRIYRDGTMREDFGSDR